MVKRGVTKNNGLSKGNNNNNNNNNGGILGSGIFGHFGSIVQCDANDNSMFCTLSKLVSTIMMLIFLAVVVYLIYYVFKTFTSSGSDSIGSKMKNISR